MSNVAYGFPWPGWVMSNIIRTKRHRPDSLRRAAFASRTAASATAGRRADPHPCFSSCTLPGTMDYWDPAVTEVWPGPRSDLVRQRRRLQF